MNALAGDDVARLAYCAGIIDGEAYIGCTRTKKLRGTMVSPRFTVRLCLMMSDREPVELVASIVGAPVYLRDRKAKPNHSRMYVLDVTAQRAVDIITKVLPYLICKKPQAQLACELHNLKAESRSNRAERGKLSDQHIAKCDELYLAMRRRSVTNNGIETRAL